VDAPSSAAAAEYPDADGAVRQTVRALRERFHGILSNLLCRAPRPGGAAHRFPDNRAYVKRSPLSSLKFDGRRPLGSPCDRHHVRGRECTRRHARSLMNKPISKGGIVATKTAPAQREWMGTLSSLPASPGCRSNRLDLVVSECSVHHDQTAAAGAAYACTRCVSP
jgi:hypothetical protein